MATSLRRRGTTVLALATVSGLSLAAFAPAGNAAKASAPAYYQGVTSANVVGVALHLPAALPEVPGLPKNLAVNLIGVNGNAVHNTLASGAATASTAQSTLANGSLVEALPDALGLRETVKATLAGQNSVEKTRFETPAALSPIAHLKVGALKADAHALTNSSSALLEDGQIAKLGMLLPASTTIGSQAINDLTAALEQTKVPGTDQTVTQTLDSALAQVKQALQAAPAGSTVAATLTQVQNALNTVLAQVKAIVSSVGDTAVLSVNTLNAQQSIAAAADAAQSTASVDLANLNLLNGLLSVKGFVSKATAVANGRPGGAHASFSGHAPIVAVGTPVLTATLDEAGLALQGVPGVGDAVNQTLKTVQSALNSLLNTLGVHLKFVPGSSKANSNGKFASAVGPEYDIVVTNPLDSSALVEVGLGHGTAASVSAAQATKTVHLPNPQEGALPHTGANLPLIGGLGVLLLLGAAYLRRRVTV